MSVYGGKKVKVGPATLCSLTLRYRIQYSWSNLGFLTTFSSSAITALFFVLQAVDEWVACGSRVYVGRVKTG